MFFPYQKVLKNLLYAFYCLLLSDTILLNNLSRNEKFIKQLGGNLYDK